jgi:hypothetical protein
MTPLSVGCNHRELRGPTRVLGLLPGPPFQEPGTGTKWIVRGKGSGTKDTNSWRTHRLAKVAGLAALHRVLLLLKAIILRNKTCILGYYHQLYRSRNWIVDAREHLLPVVLLLARKSSLCAFAIACAATSIFIGMKLVDASCMLRDLLRPSPAFP